MRSKEEVLAIIDEARSTPGFCAQLDSDVQAFRDVVADATEAEIPRLIANLTTLLMMHHCNDHN